MGQRLRNVLLYWRTARYLKTSQVFWRVRRRWTGGRRGRYTIPQPLPATNEGARTGLRDLARHWTSHAPPDANRTADFIAGRFTFLNKTIRSSHPHRRDLDVPRLWAYHLHYFDYARDVALRYPDPESPGAACVRGWINDWIEKNQDPAPVAWDAFPLSVRLLNWSLVLAVYGWDDFRIRESMHLQLAYLWRHLEHDLRGNHLLKNAVALAVAGALLNNTLGKRGLALLKKEVAEQFLPDGGHSERSPMYHTHALADLLLARAVLDPNPAWLADATQRAIAFLHGVTHGDGCAAQFNDGAAGEGLTPVTVQALAKKYYWGVPTPARSAAWPDSGLYRLTPGADAGLLVVKAGAAMLDHQPGHAHSDLLSFEYSLGQQRIFVNAGTHGYAESPYLDFCRSTAAHNTVRINGRDQMEHWSTFRVARRVHGTVDRWEDVTPSLTAGYETMHGARHQRSITWDARGWWRIIDTVSGPGKWSLESFLHLHPDCSVVPLEAGGAADGCSAYEVQGGAATVTVLVARAVNVDLVAGASEPCQGWYFPRFGEAVPAPVLVMKGRGATTARLGMALMPGPGDLHAAAADLAGALAPGSGLS